MHRRIGIALAIGLLTAGFAVGAPARLVPPTALLVVGNLTLGTGDAAVQARLQALGYTVTAVLDSATGGQDATGKAVVVISSTVTSGNVNTKFKGVLVPVVCYESSVYDDMGMTNTVQGTDYGTAATQTTVAIASASHPMAAGLTGAVTVTSSAQTFTWGAPAGGAVSVATNSGMSAIFGYDTGAQMIGLTAPARRVGFFLQDTTAGAWNSNGQALFDAAVRWAAGVPLDPAGVKAMPSSAQAVITWTASAGATSYNVKRATTSGGPYTTVGSPTTATFTSTGLTNGSTYYFVVTAVNAGGESGNSAQVVAAPPGSPTNLVATAGNAQVSLTWTPVPGADSYNVKRGTASGGPYAVVGNPTTASYTNTGLTNGTTYYYIVTSVFPAGEGVASTQASATPVTIPAAPGGLAAAPGNAQVVLTWSASAGAASYNVKRATVSGGPYATVGSAATPTFTNTGLTNGTAYYFVVSAVNGAGESGNSGQVTATPVAPPVAPTGASGTPGNGQASLNWGAVAGATGYNVKRSTTSGGPYATIASTTSPSYTDTTVVNGTTYYYVITATNAGGEGPASTQMTVTPVSSSIALLIVGNTTLGAGDAAVQTRLQGLGYTVSVKLDSASVTADATGKAVVVISSTVGSANILAKFLSVTQPVILWESAVMDDMKMTGTVSATDFGATATQTTVKIQTAWHPMAAALTGTPTVVTASDTFTWGVPGAGAVKVATLASDATNTQAVIYCYDTGATMVGQTATGRRVGFFLGDASASICNANGNALFDAAVRWCTTLPPPAPVSLTRSATTSSVTLTWTAVSGATGYLVKRSPTSGGPYTVVGSGITGLTYNDTTVTNGTAYYYVVTALNAGGEGAAAPQVTATPVAPPTGLTPTAGAGQITLTWTGVTGATGYNVKRSTTSGGPYTTVGSPAAPPFANTGLTNGTTYYYVVTATNTGGESSNSIQVSGMPATALSAPAGVTAAPGDGQVALTWNSVAGATSYTVKKLAANGASYATLATGLTATTYISTGLTNGTPSFYIVTATNGSATADSTPVSGTPFGPPTGLAASAGSGNVALSWAPSPGAVSYNLKRGAAAGGPFSTTVATGLTQTNFTNTGLSNGTTSYYVVTAVNGAVESVNSNVASATPVAAPAAPTGLAAASSAGRLTLTWTAVPGATSYTLRRSTTSGSGYAAIASGLTAATQIDNLVTDGVTYYYVVSATNAGGESANSAQASGLTLGVPANVTATAGNAQVVLNWTAVTGAASYSVKRATVQSGPYTSVGTPATPTFTSAGLTNGTTYFFVVCALNGPAQSADTTPIQAVPVGIPAAPTRLVAEPASTMVSLMWNWNGLGAFSFKVKRSTTAGGPYTEIATPVSMGYADIGRTNGTTYYYVVSAVNAAGESPNSAEAAATPTLPAAPPAPMVVSGTPSSTTSILWNFNDVTNAETYQLHDDAHVLKATFSSGGLFYEETGLTENQYASRHLHAVAAGGTSAAGTGAWSYARIHEPTTADFTVTANSSTQVTITITPPPNGTAQYTGCQIDVSPDNVSWAALNFSNVYTFQHTGLTGGKTYYYRISFRNGSAAWTGLSPARNVTTPPAPPLAPAFTGETAAKSTTSIYWKWSNVGDETGYELHDAAHNVIATTTGDIIYFLETGLSENLPYTRHVHAKNGTLTSGASADLTKYTLCRTPLPTELTLTVVSATQINLAAPAPPSAGQGGTWVEFQRCTDNYSFGVISYGPSTFVDNTVIPGVTYYYRFRYRNGDWVNAPFSQMKSASTPDGALGALGGIQVYLYGTTWIQYTFPNVTGETGYQLHDDAHAVKGTTDTDVVLFTETGLSENTLYNRHVHAMEGTFSSAASGTVGVWTRVHDPLPGNYSVSAISSTQVSITVTPPVNSTTAGAWVERAQDGNSWAALGYAMNTYTFTDTLPVPGVKTWYRFRYINGAGVPTAYSVTKIVTPPLYAPLAPSGLTGTGAGPSSIRWTWNNMIGERRFEIHDSAHVVKGTSPQDELAVVETGLAENTTYARHLQAFGDGGAGTDGAPANGTTLIHTPTLSDFALTQISPTQIDVQVTAPTNGTSPNTGVQIERSTNRSTVTNVQSMAQNYLLHDTVVSGTQYFYRISFRNTANVVTAVSPWKSLQAVPPPAAAPVGIGGFNGTGASTTSIQWWWNDQVEEASYVLHDAAEASKGTPAADVTTYLETGLTENQSVVRHLHAVNPLGTGPATGSLTRSTLIHNPVDADFTVTKVSPTQIDITINTVPPNVGSGWSTIWIERLNDSATLSAQVGFGATGPYVWHDNVQSGTTYYYRFRYFNQDNVATMYSNVKVVATDPAAPATPGFSGSATSISSIRWSWNNVWQETSYDLHDAAHAAVTPALGEDWLYFEETGIPENTSRTRHVHATNAQGQSAASTAVTLSTFVHTPTASDFTVTSTTPYQIDVNVTPPPNGTTGSTGVQIERSNDRYSWLILQYPSSSYSRSDSVGNPGTTFYYRILFTNQNGIGTVYSPIKSVTTPASAPLAPANFSGAGLNTTSIAWNWLDVIGETGYQLHNATEGVVASVGADVLGVVETGLTENTSVVRHLHAVNGAGTGAATAALTKWTLIHEPVAGDFTVALINPTTVRITATPPANSTAGASGFAVERSTDGLTYWPAMQFNTTYTWDDTNITAGVTYWYRIWYRNGEGVWTLTASPGKSAISPPVAPAAPSYVSYVTSTASTIRWTWPGVPGADSYVLHDAAHNVKGTTIGASTQYTETGLPENSDIYRHVHATNAYGTSPASPDGTFNTLVHDPVASDLTVTATSATTVSVVVTPPLNPTDGWTALDVERNVGGTWTSVAWWTQTYSFVDINLSPSTTYQYRLKFKNRYSYISGITTKFSPIKSVTTLADTTSSPSNFRTSGQTVSSITWAWDSIAAATQYKVCDLDGAVKATFPAGTLTYNETGLLENTEVRRRLVYVTAAGESAPSDANASTSVHAAAAADFSVQPITPTRVDVIVFSPPGAADNQTAVEIQRSPDNSAWTTMQAFSSAYLASDLAVTAGQTWYYRIKFRNRLGVANPSYSGSKSTSVGAPTAPASLTGTASSTSSVLWSWPDVQGESGFQLHDAFHALRETTGPGVLSVDEMSLAENTQFTRHVHGVNTLGTSGASPAGQAYTMVHTPVPAEIVLKAVSGTQVDITVLAPPNGIAGLTGCEIQRLVGGTWTTIKAFSSGYTYSDTGLTAVTAYSYRFKYRNGDGIETGYADAKSTITVAQPVVTTPSKKVRNQTVAVAGTVTAGVGSVRVYFNGVDKGVATVTGTTWSMSVAGNIENTYSVTARAFVGATPSDDSNAVTIKVDLSAPAAPTNIRTTAYNNAIDIEWDASASPDVYGYRVYRKTGAGGTWGLLNTTGEVAGTKYRDSTAANGTTYFYRVTPVDDALPN